MAARAGEAFIAVSPNFKGWRAKTEAFVKSNLKAVRVPAELDFDNKPIIAPPIKDPVVKPKVDESRFRRGMAAIEGRLDRLQRGRFLINVGIAAAPLASPLLGVAAGGLLAGSGIGTGALGGVGAFAGVSARALKNIDQKQQDGKTLTSGQSDVVTAKKNAGTALDTVAADPKLLGALATGFDALGKAVAPLSAFLGPVSTALTDVFVAFGNASASKGAREWAKTFGEFSGTILRQAGTSLLNLGHAFGNVLTAFMPLSKDMSSGLVTLTARFEKWTAGLSKSKGFQSFVEYVKTNGPILLSTIGKLGLALIAIGAAVAPLGAKMLQVVNAVAPMVANFAQAHPLIVQTGVGIIAASSALAAIAGPISKVVGLFRFLFGGIRILIGVVRGFILVMNILRIVFLTNPIGIVITLIALLVAGFIIAYKKSETFRNIVDGALHGVAKAFTFLWGEAKKVFGWLKGAWQDLVDLFNTPLKPRMDAANKTKDPTNSSGTRNRTGRTPNYYGTTDGNALGTNSWKGGLTWVGEEGPELAWLPKGTAITPNNRIGNLSETAGAFSIPVGRSKSLRVGDLRNPAGSLGSSSSGAPMRMRITNFDHMKDYIDLVAEGQVSAERSFAGTTRRMNR